MFKHFSSVLNLDVVTHIAIVNLQESLPQASEAIIRPIVRWVKPIWNLLDRQSPLFFTDYSNFNVWTLLDFIHLENWNDYISVIICIWMEPNVEFVATWWIANRKKSISNEVEKLWMITEVTTISSRDCRSKLDHVWIV